MLKDTFLHKVKTGACPNIKGYELYAKPKVVLVNHDIGFRKQFKTIEEAYETATINGEKIKDIISEAKYEDLFMTILDDSSIKII